MRDVAILLTHLIATITKLIGRGGARAIVAESLLLKHQLLILNRGRERAPNLRPMDRVIAALCADWLRPGRLLRSAIVIKPSTIMALTQKRTIRLLWVPNIRVTWFYCKLLQGKRASLNDSHHPILAFIYRLLDSISPVSAA